MPEDVSFRAFLKVCWNEIKDICNLARKHDPFLCALVECWCVNVPIAILSAAFLHPATLAITLPWLGLRWAYWMWRDYRQNDP